MNKSGKMGIGAWLAILAVAYVLIANPFNWSFGSTPAPVAGGNAQSNAPSNIYATSTALTLSGYDKANSGTAVGATNYIKAGSDVIYKTGVASLSPGTSFDLLLVNNTGYHNAQFKGEKADGTAYIKSYPMNKNATVAQTVYTTGTPTALTNGGGAVNQSSTGSNGETLTLKHEMTGANQQSTQDMVCVLDLSSSTKFDPVNSNWNMPGAVLIGTSKPASITGQGATSIYKVYSLPAIADASIKTGSFTLQAKSAQTLAGTTVKITCNTKEYFLDSYTGQVVYDIEDSQGTTKSIASYSTSFVIQ